MTNLLKNCNKKRRNLSKKKTKYYKIVSTCRNPKEGPEKREIPPKAASRNSNSRQVGKIKTRGNIIIKKILLK